MGERTGHTGHIGRERTVALLLAITTLALVLRVAWLDRAPPGLDPDEVSIGYNAYSIARTGRDEYGEVLPLAFRSFGDYKRPAFFYFSVPFLGVLGPTPFAARLPGAVAGTLLVPVVFFLARRLTASATTALLAAGFVALSPWALHQSRGAREVMLYLLVLSTMVLTLLYTLGASRVRRACVWALAAATSFVVAVFSYPGGVVGVPLLFAAVSIVYWRAALRVPRRALLAGAVALAIGLMPLAVQLRDGRIMARAAQTSLFHQDWIVKQAEGRAARNRQELAPSLAAFASAMDSRWVILGREVTKAYLSHFSPHFLFTDGDAEPRHRVPGMGTLYLWDAPLLVLGLVVIAREWKRSAYRLLALWLLVAPVPAALAENAPHALRSFAMLPPLAIVGALGARHAWQWARERKVVGLLVRATAVVLLAGSVAFYLKLYHRDYPLEHDRAWYSGWLEAFQLAAREVEHGRARRIVVPPEVREGYVYALFASKYDPALYLVHGGSTASPDWALYPEPGPMRFPPWDVRRVDWAAEPRSPDTLYVLGAWNQIPAGARVIATTRGPSGREALRVLTLPAAPE